MNGEPPYTVIFFQTSFGREPVRDWLKTLEKEDRKIIGEDMKLVQFRWPLGMPLVRKLERDLWEVRTNLTGNRIARILFTVRDSKIVLLHSFVKKSQKIPMRDLDIGRTRRDLWHSEE